MLQKLARMLIGCLVLYCGALVLLPVAYRFINPPFTTPMLWRMVNLQNFERTSVPLSMISGQMPRLLVGMEDARFCEHHGIDWQELKTVLGESGGPSRGASTLTMQLARNLFLWQGGAYGLGTLRKGLEIPLAFYLEMVLPKRRIIELYLNAAEMGPNGQFGVYAGSAYAFGRKPNQLTEGQGALLVAILPNPKEFSARNPGLHARRRGAIALSRGRDADVSCLQ